MIALIILELLYLILNLLYDYDRISKHIPVRHPIDTVPVYIIYATTMLMCMYAQDIPPTEIVKNAFELAGVRWLVHSTGLAYLRNLPLDYIDTEHDISFTDKLLLHKS